MASVSPVTVATAGLLAAAGCYYAYVSLCRKGQPSSRHVHDAAHDDARETPLPLARRHAPRTPDGTAQITQLWIYPIKSCRGVRVSEATVTENGLLLDREWAIVRLSDGKILTQREHPELALVVVEIDQARSCLRVCVAAEEAERRNLLASLTVTLAASTASAEEVPIKIWHIDGSVTSVGADATAWFSSFLKVPCFLGRIARKRVPAVSPNHKSVTQADEVINIQDFSSLHIITEEGIDAIQESVTRACKEEGRTPPSLDVRRYRPNVVLSGVPFPDEDTWSRFSIRGTNDSFQLRVAKLCGRCSVPTVDPDSGIRPLREPQPLAALKQSREMFYAHQIPMTDLPGRQQWPMFGLNVFHGGTGIIRVGDRVSDIHRHSTSD